MPPKQDYRRPSSAVRSDSPPAPAAASLAALRGAKILLVEDEAIIATDIEFALDDAGAEVVGPAGTLRDALQLVEDTSGIRGAILDINLAGESVIKVADRLVSRAVPMIFHTGCDLAPELERRFPDAQVMIKPVPIEKLLLTLASRIG